MDEPRTVEEFVQDLMSDGRNLKQILAVAQCTRWKTYEEEITDCYKKIKRARHKKGH